MELKPQLAENLALEDVDPFLNDGTWWMEQKFDGHRVMIVIEDGKVTPINRKGNAMVDPVTGIPNINKNIVKDFSTDLFHGVWIFDGELLPNKYVVFDMLLAADKPVGGRPYSERRQRLANIVELWEPPHVIHAPVAKSTEEKKAMLEAVYEAHGEGVMLKQIAASYVPMRTPHLRKVKFVKTADVIVTEIGRDGKANLVMSVFDGLNLIEVGKVTALAGDGPRVRVGDIVEVQYLSWLGKNLIQPTMPKLRNDKDAWECTIDQFVLSDKEVVVV